MTLEVKIKDKYRGIYAVTECELLCRRSFLKTSWGSGGAVSLSTGPEQSAGGGEAPGSSEKFAFYSTKNEAKKHLCGAFFSVLNAITESCQIQQFTH